MIRLMIVYAIDQTMAFKINADTFYLKFGPNSPKIYDESLKPLITPNLDAWIQAKTYQRYSLSLLSDMCEAFKAGLERNYTKDDLTNVADCACMSAINEIMKNGVVYDYSITYWIEVLGSDKIEKYLKVIANKLEYVVNKMGYDKLVIELARIHKICVLRQINARFVCEKILERLNVKLGEVVFPDSTKLDKKVLDSVRHDITKSIRNMDKTVSDVVIRSINIINENR